MTKETTVEDVLAVLGISPGNQQNIEYVKDAVMRLFRAITVAPEVADYIRRWESDRSQEGHKVD